MGTEDRQGFVVGEIEEAMSTITDTAVLSSANDLLDEYQELFSEGYENDDEDMMEEALDLLHEMLVELKRNK
jgi:hypothetical protein